MSRLLSASFIRLRKDKLFWIGTLFMVAAGIFIPVMRYMDMQREDVENCRAACVCFCPEDGIALYIIYRPYALMWQRRVVRCAKKHYLWSL